VVLNVIEVHALLREAESAPTPINLIIGSREKGHTREKGQVFDL